MRFSRILRAARHPYTEYQVQKAKKVHRKQHPRCALCNVKPTFFGRNNDVHHLVPVHINPDRAADPSNLITLCRLHHWLVGHLRNWKDYNTEIHATIEAIKAVFQVIAHSHLKGDDWYERLR